VANPILNEQAFQRSGGVGTLPPPERAGWGAPAGGLTTGGPVTGGPITDGPVTPWERAKVMTLDGVVITFSALFVLLLISAAVGWNLVEATDGTVTSYPGWTIGLILGGFAAVLVAVFRPTWSRWLAPLYAVLEGVFLGAISHAYETYYDGIVVQAVGATLAVTATMLVLYSTRIITVTDKFRSVVMTATIGLAVFYGISLVLRLFGVNVPFLQSTSLFGIGFSVFAAGLAALNLLLDFDVIERGVKSRAPGHMNWFASLGLLVTLVWLYLELLRLLAKLRER
jgi:uncharacterized YccA/Bax inhibitor family protein